jgi:hypothetical protein
MRKLQIKFGAMVTLLLFLLALGHRCSAQNNFEEAFLDKLYIGYGIDPMMLAEGPGYSYTDLTSTYHWSLELGWEDDISQNSGIRIGMVFSDHDAIAYRKWTFFKADYKLRNNLFWLLDVQGLNQYAGMEISHISRRNIPYPIGPSGIQLYHNPQSLSLGINIETQYEYPLTQDEDGLRIAIGEKSIKEILIEIKNELIDLHTYYRIHKRFPIKSHGHYLNDCKTQKYALCHIAGYIFKGDLVDKENREKFYSYIRNHFKDKEYGFYDIHGISFSIYDWEESSDVFFEEYFEENYESKEEYLEDLHKEYWYWDTNNFKDRLDWLNQQIDEETKMHSTA